MLINEQKSRRLMRATSSVVAGALGISDYMTPIQAWLAIKGEANIQETKAMRRGTRLEQFALDETSEILEMIWRPAEFRTHPKHDWTGDSADAYFLDKDGNLAMIAEAKTAGAGVAHKWGDEGTNQIPNEYLVQCHWHLIHWPETDTCIVPVLIGGYEFEFRTYYVHRDAELEGNLIDSMGKFYRDYVMTNKMPPASAGDTKILSGMYPVASTEFLADNPEIEALAREKDKITAQISKLSDAEEEVKNKIKQMLGEAKGVSGHWGKITYTNAKDKQQVDYHSIVAELNPSDEIIAKHTKTVTGSRTLRVTLKGV